MNDDIISAIRELYHVVKNSSDEECVSLSVFINYQGFSFKANHRTPETLIENRISMKNIRGELIE